MNAEILSVSIKDANRLTGISETTIRKAINTLALPAYRVGRAIRVRVPDLDEWIQSLPRVGDDA